MKNLKSFSLFLLLLMSAFGLSAQQNGNVVVSEVKIYDLENGTAVIEVRLSGNLVSEVTNAFLNVSGPGMHYGGFATDLVNTRVSLPTTNEEVLTAIFPYTTQSGNDDGLNVTVSLRRIGHGIDYTYSHVGRPKRNFKY